MGDLNAIVDRYIAVWNETDAGARRKAIDDLWAERATYVDPLASVSGRDGFDQVVAGAQEQFAGLKFARGTVFDEHHNVVRFTWHLVSDPTAEPIAIGFDVAAVDDTGKIGSVYGFIDKMPAG
jgi:hypothetical protein